jgi:PadR family transcriptional regulator, regulatory protein PadR
MAETAISSDILRGHTDTIILGLLLDGDKYGYEISKLIQQKSENTYQLKESTMFSSLKRIESEGYADAYWGDETQGGRRRYYSITQKGKELYIGNKKAWESAKRILDLLL